MISAVNPHSAVYIAELERTVIALQATLTQAKKFHTHEYHNRLELETTLERFNGIDLDKLQTFSVDSAGYFVIFDKEAKGTPRTLNYGPVLLIPDTK